MLHSQVHAARAHPTPTDPTPTGVVGGVEDAADIGDRNLFLAHRRGSVLQLGATYVAEKQEDSELFEPIH